MDTVQILLIITLVLTTLFLTVIVVQLVLTLREFSKTLRKANRVIDGFESVGVDLNKGMNEISGFVNGFKTTMKLLDTVSHTSHETEKR